MIDKDEFCIKLIEAVDDVCFLKESSYVKRSYGLENSHIRHDSYNHKISIIDENSNKGEIGYSSDWNYYIDKEINSIKCYYGYNLPTETFCRHLCAMIHTLRVNVPYEYGILKKLIEIAQKQNIGF